MHMYISIRTEKEAIYVARTRARTSKQNMRVQMNSKIEKKVELT